MHKLEPYSRWRDNYRSAEDPRSPFFGRQYELFGYTQQVYNYYIHPQWDEFGSETLYAKILFVDYAEGFAIIELIGEWNDCLYDDVAYFKEQVIDLLLKQGIGKYLILGEYVFNFHSSEDDDHYAAWIEEAEALEGWICCLNFLPHVVAEMRDAGLDQYLYLGPPFSGLAWRPQKPQMLLPIIQELIDDFEIDSLRERYELE